MKTASELIGKCRRIVVKIGSALVTSESGEIRERWFDALASDISALMKGGHEIVIVSSGSIALGRPALGIDARTPRAEIALDLEQAAAAAGQIHLSLAYHRAFAAYGVSVAQVLLSPNDTENRRSHLNARATVNALLSRGIIPVINENDSVATEEIRFGDNDRLAARVGQMVGADLVVLLSTADGLYTSDPLKNPGAGHIPYVEAIGPEHYEMAGDAPAGISTGGMISKLDAARLAVNAGAHMLIADGMGEHALSVLQKDEGVRSTVFKAVDNPPGARKRWIESHIRTRGVLVINECAVDALLGGKSLLPVGVTAVEGSFERGDAVTVRDEKGKDIAIGLIAFDAPDARKIAGLNSRDLEAALGFSGRSEMIHRNDMAIVKK